MNAHTPASPTAPGVRDGYHAATPFLVVAGAAAALDFYKSAFDAVELSRFVMDGGFIGHAEIRIGDSPLMLWDEYPESNSYSPKHYGGSPQGIRLYVENADEVVRRAVAAGATLRQPVTDQFFGERMGAVIDPFGHTWRIATHMQDVTPEEMKRRVDAWAKTNPEWRDTPTAAGE